MDLVSTKEITNIRMQVYECKILISTFYIQSASKMM